ncbi:MAG: thioether cross-link-forming SCIFF peptide maturase [Lachnospiraceae bacterium]|nr:thioether cross-link-forming SCIFF peptide maturase [Lachnospiraceae bacterium]
MIHQFTNNDYHIVMDVGSGAVHAVDRLVYDAVALMAAEVADMETPAPLDERVTGRVADALAGTVGFPAGTYTREDIQDALAQIQGLIDMGQLFVKDTYEGYVRDFKARKTVVKALCLHVAHDCNLACRYCFAEEGEYHGRRALMGAEVGKKALDFLVVHSGNRKNLEVDFFGGEPLMNWGVVKELVAYGRSLEGPHGKRFRFTLTTNGVLLDDEVTQFCNREMANVVLSLDGRKGVNDRMRPMRGGQGSYDRIVPRFRSFVAQRGSRSHFLRGTFTRHNLDFSQDILHFLDLGFTKLSMEPVVAADAADAAIGCSETCALGEPKGGGVDSYHASRPGGQAAVGNAGASADTGNAAGGDGCAGTSDGYALREEDLPAILAEYDRLARIYLERRAEGRGFEFFHFNIDLTGGPCVAKRMAGCGAGTEYLAVTPWGDLYPCHQFVGREDYLLGNVEDGITRPDICDTFKYCNVYAKEDCRGCFARFYCSGGCAANAQQFGGDIHGTYRLGCEMQKKRVECALMIQAALAGGAA